MKQLLIVALMIFCLSFYSAAFSQVAIDFEDEALGTQGFADNGWGTAFTSVAWAADPSGMSTGTMALACDGTQSKGVIQINNWDPQGAAVISFDVYLPVDFPDGASLSFWAQDNSSWSHTTSTGINGSALPKETWVPINFDIKQLAAINENFNPYDGTIFGKAGMQVYFGSSGGTFSGTVYVDNISFIGIEPDVVKDFEDEAQGTQGFADNGWGTAFTSVAWSVDSTGISTGTMALACDGTQSKGVIQINNWDPQGAMVISFDVYLPSDFPDGASLSFWGQDNSSWSHTSSTGINGSALPKETWVPINFNVKQLAAMNENFNPYDGTIFGKTGMQVYFGSSGGTFAGNVYVDNISFLGFVEDDTTDATEWVVADFENELLGTQGFVESPSYYAITDLGWAADPTARSIGVLKTDWDASKGANDFIQNKNVDLKWTESDTGATAMSIDIWIPVDVPEGTDISIYAKDKINWTWTETHFTISDSTVVPGEWNTITYNVKDHLDKLNPVGVIETGVQLFFADLTWTGTVYFDNFTLVGAEKPSGVLKSPDIFVKADTSDNGYLNNKIEWVDNDENLDETYNVYASLAPISDLSADGVTKISSKIPRNIQYWNHRPFTTDGSEQAYYYAATATGVDGIETELNGANVSGPNTITSSITYKAVYDPNFNFSIDGSLAEFDAHTNYTIVPEFAGADKAEDWTPESTDINFTATLVIDDEYLYLGANVVDDDLAESGQAWEGDAFEMYIGLYNALDLDAWHSLDNVEVSGTGDHRFGFCAWGETQFGSSVIDWPGLDFLILNMVTSYQIEARFALDSLAASGWTPQVGDFMPFSLNANDKDPVADFPDSSRTKQLNASGSSNTESWKRPSSWAYLEVISPTAVDGQVVQVPLKTQLYANYPNPFNPNTTMKYDLKENSHVSLVVYNMLGQKIKTLVDVHKTAGHHSIEWDGTNDIGVQVSSGIYFYTYKTKSYTNTHKMILMK